MIDPKMLTTSPLPRYLIAILALAVWALASPARAEERLLDTMLQAAKDAPAKLYEGKAKTYGTGVMPQDVLKACLILAHEIDTTGTEIAGHKTAIRTLDDSIQEAGPRLQKESVAALTNPERRKAYQVEVAAYNAWVEDRRQAVAEHNRLVKLFAELSGRFNSECNGRSYYPSDLEYLKNDLPTDIRAKVQ